VTAVYRVVVRGQFSDLDDDLRARLLAEAADHDLFRSAFTAEGTFTYDERLIAFNLRYEIRVPEDALGTTSGPERNDQSDAPSGDVGRVVEAEAMTRARSGSPPSASPTSTSAPPQPTSPQCGTSPDRTEASAAGRADECSAKTRASRTQVPAEREGFEPSNPCGSPVFKTGAFVRSATAPPVKLTLAAAAAE